MGGGGERYSGSRGSTLEVLTPHLDDSVQVYTGIGDKEPRPPVLVACVA